MKKLLFLLSLFIVTLPVFSDTGDFRNQSDISESISGFSSFLDAMVKNHPAYAANQEYLNRSDFEYKNSKSSVYPQLNLNLTGGGSDNFNTRYAEGIEIKNNYSYYAGPSLSFSQLLPSSGTISGSVSDSLSYSGIEESSYPSYPQSEGEYINSLDLGLSFAQPLTTDNIYKASETIVSNSLKISEAGYLNNRNLLVIKAANDYLNQSITAYQVTLIKSRLEGYREEYRKIEREFELGYWTKSQLNSAKAAMLQSETDLLKAERSLNLIRQQILNLYGIDASDKVLEKINLLEINDSELNGLEKNLHESSPDIRIARLTFSSAESNTVVEKKDRHFNLNASAEYSLDSGIDNDYAADTLSFTLSMSAPPIRKWNSTGQKAAESEAERAGYLLDEQIKTTIAEFQSLTDSIRVNTRLDEIYILQVETAEFELEKTEAEFSLGTATRKELFETQINLENAKLSVFSNRAEIIRTVLELYKISGLDLLQMLAPEMEKN